jgi:exopolysaccharide biosynthesis protein
MKRKKKEKHTGMGRKLLLLFADVSFAALLVLGIYIYYYKIPQPGILATASSPGMEQTMEVSQEIEYNSGQPETLEDAYSYEEEEAAGDEPQMTENGLTITKVNRDTTDWHQKFQEHFTNEAVLTETSYTSPQLSIQITKESYDSGIVDISAEGKHKKYGTKVAYTLADVYIGDITCFQTAFAKDTYGNGYSEKLGDMALRLGSVLAVNGDSYNNNRHQNNGTIIRNGLVYRSQRTDMETCVLNWDGTMQIYEPADLNIQTLIDRGAYQSWVFGPSLLDENGKAKQDFLTWDYIQQSHPRTAIGYYEPGHYCFLVVDGREPGYSRGMFLSEEAKLFEQLGCRAAYNLDGGHCSFMALKGQIISQPYKTEHEVPDGIFILE